MVMPNNNDVYYDKNVAAQVEGKGWCALDSAVAVTIPDSIF